MPQPQSYTRLTDFSDEGRQEWHRRRIELLPCPAQDVPKLWRLVCPVLERAVSRQDERGEAIDECNARLDLLREAGK